MRFTNATFRLGRCVDWKLTCILLFAIFFVNVAYRIHTYIHTCSMSRICSRNIEHIVYVRIYVSTCIRIRKCMLYYNMILFWVATYVRAMHSVAVAAASVCTVYFNDYKNRIITHAHTHTADRVWTHLLACVCVIFHFCVSKWNMCVGASATLACL